MSEVTHFYTDDDSRFESLVLEHSVDGTGEHRELPVSSFSRDWVGAGIPSS